jgi:hypothetical protein
MAELERLPALSIGLLELEQLVVAVVVSQSLSTLGECVIKGACFIGCSGLVGDHSY